MSTERRASVAPSTTVLPVLGLILGLAMIVVGGSAVWNVALLVTQGGSAVQLDATLDAPLVVERGGNRWEIGRTATSGVIGDPGPVGGVGGFSPDSVRGHVTIFPDEGPTAIYRLGIALGALLVLAGLLMLRHVVSSARDGIPFDRSNVRRLRVAGVCALAIPGVGNATEWALVNAADVGDAVRLHPSLVPWWPFVLLSAGAFGLGEIFRRGAELDDFERLAI